MSKYVKICIFVMVIAYLLNPISAYTINSDGSIQDGNKVLFGVPTFYATDGNIYLKSEYAGADYINYGTYYGTDSPSSLSARFYPDGRIYLGQDNNHYIGIKPTGIFYINSKNINEREQLISLSNPTLSVNNNVATYTKGPVTIKFTNSFERIKGEVIFPNSLPYPTVSNPYLVVIWEVIGYKGLELSDGDKNDLWFDDAKSVLPIGYTTNNGTYTNIVKIFNYIENKYLAVGINYSWASDVNRTDSYFNIDPTIEYNGSDAWAGTSGTMWIHGDGFLRSPPSVTTNLITYHSYEDMAGGTIMDVYGSNNGIFTNGLTGNWTNGKYGGAYNADNINDEYTISTSPFYLSGATEMDIMFWIYVDPNEFTDTLKYIINTAHTSPATYNGFQVTLDDRHATSPFVSNGSYFSIKTGSTYESVKTNNEMFTNSGWYHIRYNYSYDSAHIFINGLDQTVLRVNGNGDFIPRNAMMYVGGHSPTSSFANKTIDELYMYNKSLTNLEYLEIMNNYHTNFSYRRTDNIINAISGNVWKYFQTIGTDASVNTSLSLYINGSDDNITFNGWELVNSSFNVNDTITISAGQQYQYAQFKLYSNTTYQPETNIISNITITSEIIPIFIPPTPRNLTNITYLYGANFTWNNGATHQAGGGDCNACHNHTNSFNITYINNSGTFYSNGSALNYINISTVEYGFIKIYVWAYNMSGTGTLSTGYLYDHISFGTMWTVIEESIDSAIYNFGIIVNNIGSIIVTTIQIAAIYIICTLIGIVISIGIRFFRW